MKASSALGHDHKKTLPADILIDNWGLGGKAAALDVSVTSRNKPEIILEASVTAAVATKNWKLSTSMVMGWECSRHVWCLGRQSNPTISHYVLSNNLKNDTKTFNNPTTCNPLASCNYSFDLRDLFISCVGCYGGKNMTNLDYNVKIFTFFAVNGAGNGDVTIYILVL